MTLQVLSKEPNATNWIIAGLKRHKTNDNTFKEACEEVAKELKFDFKFKDANIAPDQIYFFKDKDNVNSTT